jgi:hypothetical protein
VIRLTDLVALLSMDLVVCAILVGLVSRLFPAVFKADRAGEHVNRRVVGFAGITLIFLWVPYGLSMLPLLAYARGIVSDLSITSVILACLALRQQFWSRPASAPRERLWLGVAVVLAAGVLYPTALGWGNWDAYRSGWGSPLFFAVCVITALVALSAKLQLVPFVMAAGVLAWAAGLLESGNLWDYLLDPWVTLWACWHLLAAAAGAMRRRLAHR